MNGKENLQSAIVFDCFAEVNKVPLPSKREEKRFNYSVQLRKL